MPLRSQAQRRWMHWAEGEGKVPPGTAERWEEHTPKGKKLPEKVMKKSAFFVGFSKRAAEQMGEPTAAVPGEAPAQDAAGGMPAPPPEKMLKWNPSGGVDPRSPEEMAAAQAVDLITLPEGAEGASCGNCKFFRQLDPGLGTGFCTNPEVKLDTTNRMHCSRWDATGAYRAWMAEDPSMVPNAALLQEAAGVDATGLPAAAASMPPGMAGMAGGAPEGAATDQLEEKGPGGEGVGADGSAGGAPSPKSKDEKPKEKKDEKGGGKDSSGHTINVHVNNGGAGGDKDEKDKDKGKEKKAFWKGFEP